jgi:outer membrane autotransporter protein
MITLSDSSSISTEGDFADCIRIVGDSGAITLNGSSSISTKGAYAYGISISGNNGTITFNDSSSITSLGLHAVAVRFSSGSNTLVNRGTLQSVDTIAVVGASDDDNSDIVRNYGIIIGGTTAIRLRSGNDSLLLGTGSAITGDINGGDGSDILTLTGEGSEDDDFLNFETLTMSGTDWALSGTSTFDNITIETGRLRVNGEIEATNITLLEADATLGGSGTLISDVASEGTIAPGNSVGTLTIDGDFMQTGGSFEAEFDQSGIDLLTVTGGAILSDSPTLTVVSLTGITSASGVILHADDGIFGTFGSIEFEGNGAAVLDYSTNDITLTVADGSPILASTQTALKTAFSFFDYAGADHETSCDKGTNDVNHDGTCRRLLWAKSFGQWGSEDAQSTTGAFDYRIAGLAVGADAMIGHGRRVGGSFGAALADDTLAQDAAETSLTSFLGALHITQNVGLAFITASLLGGLELMELSRLIATNSGVSTAEASPMGTVAGVSLEAGIDLRLSDRWTVTPSLWASYIHQWVESYEESGDALDVDAHEASALRTKAEIKAAHATMLGATMLSPHVKLGIAVDVPMGGTASASLAGEDFEINLEDTREVSAIGGVGFDLDWSNGAKGYLSYESEMSRTATAHTLMGGVQFIW